MTGRTLVLLRHGRTEWNATLRVQGQSDVDLDDVGREQAAAVAPAMAALAPSVLWCSDLLRARETAARVAGACGLTAVPDARLRELYFGAREGLSREEFAEIDPAGYEAMRRGEYHRIDTAEPADAVRDRMLAALRGLLDGLDVGETALAVSHGAAIRIAVGALLDWPADQFGTLHHLDNCGWVVLREHPFSGDLQLAAYNRTV